MEEKDSAEIDLKSILVLFYNSWPIILLIILGSLIFSGYLVSKTTPKCVATTIFETRDTSQDNRQILPNRASELSAVLPVLTRSQPKLELVPKIIGGEFLARYIEEYNIKKKLAYEFSPSKVSIFSLAGLLNFLSLYEIKLPTEEQSDENFISSVRSMILIDNYKYNRIKTSSTTLQVKHEDPEIAAFIANTIVEYYFQTDQSDKRKVFEESMFYIAEIASKSQIELEEIKKEMDDFIFNNPSLLASSNLENQEIKLDPGMQFEKYSQLEIKKKSIEKTIQFLIEKKINKALISADFGSQGQISANYSNIFIREVRKLQQDQKTEVEPALIIVVNKEIERLKDLKRILSNRINAEKLLAEENFRLENEYKSINLKYLIKKKFTEGLDVALQDKVLKSASFNIDNNKVHSRASPPSSPVEPKIKTIFLINLVIAIIVSSFIVLLNQMLRQKIYNIKQLEQFQFFKHIITVPSQLLYARRKGLFGKSSQKGLSVSFLDSLANSGRPLCVVEIGKKNFFSQFLANRVALFMSVVIGQNSDKKVALIDNKLGLKESGKFQDKFNEVFETKLSYDDLKSVSISNFPGETSSIEKGTLFPLSDELKHFDHVLIPLGEAFSEVIKYNAILESGNYLLVGVKGKFTKEDIKKFLTNTNSETKNCIGFILID